MLHGGAERHERRGPMMRCSCRRLTGRCPVPCGSAVGFAVSLTACTVQVVKRRRWQRSSGSRALVAAGRTAMEGSETTCQQQCVLNIKGWASIADGIWGAGVDAKLTAVLCDLAGRSARSQARRGAFGRDCPRRLWAAAVLHRAPLLRAAGRLRWYVAGNTILAHDAHVCGA